ncbi:MAG: ribonuclease J [Desulfovibrionaceae bacterium]|nr:ribonuclease J [Desulfovibrionaceae bacterium]
MQENNSFLSILPLGGLGEIGLNAQLWTTPKALIMVDCGMMFPEEEHLGIDVIIPTFEHILANQDRFAGLILTHGHEDHIGAIPYLISKIKTSIYGSKYTLGLVEAKLSERNLLSRARLIPISEKTKLSIGDIKFRFFPMTHSIIGCYALAAETPVGKVLHTGDFKIDKGTEDTVLAPIREFAGDEGIQLLLSDSTNIEAEGHSSSEEDISKPLQDLFETTKGRIIVTLFSSHVERIQKILDFAEIYGRTVVVCGRSLHNNIQISSQLGYLTLPSKIIMDPNEIPNLPDEELVILATGSQGETFSALSRMIMGSHRQFAIHKGDTVIMSSRFIPGNLRAITRLIDELYKRGASVFHGGSHKIHVSGHGYKEELRAMLLAAKPKYFMPIHGEYRHLCMHAELGKECGVHPNNTIVIENGTPLILYQDGFELGEKVNVEPVLVDGKGVGDIGPIVLKERKILGEEGVVIINIVLNSHTWDIIGGPYIITRGFVFEQSYRNMLNDSKNIVYEELDELEKYDRELFKDKLRSGYRRFFKAILQRDPIIIPILNFV